MKLSELVSELADRIASDGDIELGDDFLISMKYGQIRID